MFGMSAERNGVERTPRTDTGGTPAPAERSEAECDNNSTLLTPDSSEYHMKDGTMIFIFILFIIITDFWFIISNGLDILHKSYV